MGPAFQIQQAGLWGAGTYAWLLTAALMAGLAAARWRGRSEWGIGFAFVAAALLAFSATGLRATHFSSQGLAPALEGRDLALTGVVSAMPHRSEAGVRFRMRVESASLAGAEVRVPPQVALGWYGGVLGGEGRPELQRQPAELRAGERWQMTVRLKAPHGHLNPHGFDYELWLWEQGLQATGYVRAGPADPRPQRIASTWQHPVEQLRQQVRDAIFARVEDRRLAGILAALVVGDQGAIERADWDVFRATGVAHLMSISGLHVTMFAWAAALAVRGLWRRSTRLCLRLPAQQAGLLGGMLLALAYAIFSGWGVPAQRTVWMLAAVGWLRLGARAWPWPHVWLLACATVVTVDPWALLQPGFWLSFVAVGVLFATDPGAASAPRGLPARTLALLREQWIVTLALTPLSLLLFGQVSLVGMLANLVAIPWVTLVVTPLGLAGVVIPVAWDGAAAALAVLASALGWLAQLPFATLSTAAPPVWAGVAGVLGGTLLAMRWPPAWRAMGLPLLLPVLLWQPARPPPGEFELLAADVGQGNAVLVRTATHTLVYDAGPAYSRESDAGQRVVVPLLRALGETVDTIVLSHRDIDHTGGAPAVLGMQPQARLVSSLEDGHPLLAGRPAARCETGQGWEWDGVRFEVLHPAAADYRAGVKPNTVSCVLRIANGRRQALLAGDIERAQEEALLTRGASALRADILLVPHHGSKTSSSTAWLAAVRPTTALVQAGYRNRFGHPAPEVVQRYSAQDIALIESARCGAARWRSARPEAVDCERVTARRYWHHRPP
ncbi:DNA internalization-related competence protein ComEC/Rec2 [Caenimonas sedimenti]|uniref:DNA internalization-related competence protein ComEC/Rec2 n=1 Tax=Caenimonas sedimenti TaxID=2596921 RepID=A0A562ZXS3_9BURK|nr:DNA internalization-related competence protein ComEC/Rec2 [Caenimonas sedimenti]TWO73273.1 DNA internalization-related competence protein ComEC/Rec2 [Caenimonas sedimenti]